MIIDTVDTSETIDQVTFQQPGILGSAIINDTTIEVTMVIEEDVRKFIKQDAVASLFQESRQHQLDFWIVFGQ